MKRPPRMPGSGVRLPVPPDVKTAVRDWEKKRELQVFSQDTREDAADPKPDWQAIATLSARGCSTTDIVDVLELLWCYGKTTQFKNAKESREDLLDRAKELVQRLRDLADDTEKMEQLLGISAPATSTSEPPVLPPSAMGQLPSPATEIDSDDDSPDQSPSPATESDSNDNSSPLPQSASVEIESEEDGIVILDPEPEPEVWDVMRREADNLESYVNLMTDKELPFAEPFTRRFAGTVGTLVWLVASAALIEDATGRSHYPEIATLLGIVCSHIKVEKRTEDRIVKDVTRFRERNEEFVSEFLEEGQVRNSVREWLRNLQRSQSQ